MLRVISKQELDNFSSSTEHSQFLESSFWEEFQNLLGKKVWRYGYFDDNNQSEILGAFLIIEKKLPFNFGYLYTPRGPIIKDKLDKSRKIEISKNLFKLFRDICVKEFKIKNIFFRFEANFIPENIKQIKKVKDFQPSKTLILDLLKNEEELLKDMHEKTRYNIRLAEKKGIQVIKTNKEKEYIGDFLNLIEKTSKRDNFKSHSGDYYLKMLKSSDKNIDLWIAKKDNKVICTNIVVNFGDTVTYLHGASSNEYRNLMAPHLLQWSQIRWAKENNYRYYDFWGIAKTDDKNDAWRGFTRFKKGFGGFELEYPGTFDVIYDKNFYSFYNFFKKFF
ncbi:MAG: peptidoglycan bridge formation glycyltransferase FemA/FemB family protein [Patescibacteria group bacterium]|nr:peptidoglycan bridge formation glycyltransferase FemA/FemB family protein [Patescibacteria group bacterium]